MQRSVRMKKEVQMFTESPPHGISCWTKDDTLFNLEAQILGGEDTPYAGGVFKLEIQIPDRGAWKPILNISTVLTSIQLLMAEPNPEDPLMTDISNEFTHNRSLYVQTAREWTNRHAKQKSGTEQYAHFEAGDNLVDNLNADGKAVCSRKRPLPMDDVTNIPTKLP